MANELALYNPTDESVVVYQSEDGTLQLDVQLSDETVWLTQQQMSLLFNTSRNNITLHISNIFREQELDKNSVCKESLLTAADGKTYRTNLYNLDVIISVGYRVKSVTGTRFRQWANKVLKDYLLHGHALNQQLLYMEQRIDNRFLTQEKRLEAVENKVEFFVRTNQTPVEQVFFGGEFFAARVVLEKLIKTAQHRVIIIDRYVDASTFEMLDVRQKGVTAAIYSEKDFLALRDAHNATAGVEPIDTFVWGKPSHDRWLIIDDTLYHCGHSLKDMGQKLSAISLMGTPAQDIIDQIK
ncbi:MAG: virulence RhuM family protein [Paludibacteraceae bacterium]|nr:virulence RhuM family protein [Paludibacteraceae bacterium]